MVPQVRVRLLDANWVGQFPEKSKTQYQYRRLRATHSVAQDAIERAIHLEH